MNEKRWVQHMSGQGEKWEVAGEIETAWPVFSKHNRNLTFYLPKSEYLLCEPPEKWEDVTKEYAGNSKTMRSIHVNDDERITCLDGWHNGPAFVIERKKP